jgi:hypothetical protein
VATSGGGFCVSVLMSWMGGRARAFTRKLYGTKNAPAAIPSARMEGSTPRLRPRTSTSATMAKSAAGTARYAPHRISLNPVLKCQKPMRVPGPASSTSSAARIAAPSAIPAIGLPRRGGRSLMRSASRMGVRGSA